MKKRNLFWSGWIIERGRWRHALSKEQTTEKESVCVDIRLQDGRFRFSGNGHGGWFFSVLFWRSFNF